MEVVHTQTSRLASTDFDNLAFGNVFSDHMLTGFFRGGRWRDFKIVPFDAITIKPSNMALHYGQSVFEGMKAFYRVDNTIALFRARDHHARLNRSCNRMCIPGIDSNLFFDGLLELIRVDREWVPKKTGHSLYIRPLIFAADNNLGVRPSETYQFFIITSPVGAYYKEGISPVKLMTSGSHVRAADGGVGDVKTAGNYGASLYPQRVAKERGYTQVLWLDAKTGQFIDEVGTMNVFFVFQDELVTPPLSGAILPGITRDSVIRLAQEWQISVIERQVSIDEILTRSRNGELKEAFGTGTAAVISPIGEIAHEGATATINHFEMGPLAQRIYDELTGIMYGTRADQFKWCTIIV